MTSHDMLNRLRDKYHVIERGPYHYQIRIGGGSSHNIWRSDSYRGLKVLFADCSEDGRSARMYGPTEENMRALLHALDGYPVDDPVYRVVSYEGTVKDFDTAEQVGVYMLGRDVRSHAVFKNKMLVLLMEQSVTLFTKQLEAWDENGQAQSAS